MIETFQKKYPLVSYDIFTANADLIKEQMEKGLVDIGVLLEPIDTSKFDFIRLNGKERWVVLMRPDDPLAGKEAISAKDLENQPIILPRRTNVQNELSNFAKNLGEAVAHSSRYLPCFGLSISRLPLDFFFAMPYNNKKHNHD